VECGPVSHHELRRHPVREFLGELRLLHELRKDAQARSGGGLERSEGKFSWVLNYSLIDATYQSSAVLFSQANSTADANGDIQVSPGNRIPGIPRHHLNAVANYDLTDRITVGAGAVAVSRQFARGNDNNQHQPDGVNFLGRARSADTRSST